MGRDEIVVVENQSSEIAGFLKFLLEVGEINVRQGDVVFRVKAVRSNISIKGREFLISGGPTEGGL